MGFFFDYFMTHLVYVSILVVFASGVVVIYSMAGVFTLGHQGFMAIGAYATVGIAAMLPAQAPPVLGLSVWLLSLLAAVAASALGGLLLIAPSLRLRGDYMALATLAFGEILLIVIRNTEPLGGMRGLEVMPLWPRAVGAARPWVLCGHAAVAVGLAVLTMFVVQRLTRSSLGVAVRGLRDDELAGRSMGLSLYKARLVSLCFGAALCGLAGCLYANFSGHISPRDFDFLRGAMILLFVVLGGNSIYGTAAAVAVVYLVDEALKLRIFGLVEGAAGRVLVDWKDVMLAAVIIALLVWKPAGLLRQDPRRGTA